MTPQNKPRAVVFDIDGTLADYSHRAHHLIPPERDMKVFFSKMEKDPPVPEVIALLVEALKKGYRVILVTGRPGQYYKATERWLLANNIRYNELFLRHRDDWRPGVEVRREVYQKLIEPYYDVVYAVDDNPKMIDLWKSLGVKSLLVGTGKLPETP